MRTIPRYAIQLFLLCAGIPIFAQERVIEKNEFDWFNKEGLLLKSEYSFINTSLRMTYKTSTIYEYDPRITIEPPVVDPETKSNRL
jgi:hypothetical protein